MIRTRSLKTSLKPNHAHDSITLQQNCTKTRALVEENVASLVLRNFGLNKTTNNSKDELRYIIFHDSTKQFRQTQLLVLVHVPLCVKFYVIKLTQLNKLYASEYRNPKSNLLIIYSIVFMVQVLIFQSIYLTSISRHF